MELTGGKEYNLKRVPYHGKLIVAPVRDQKNTGTCFIHSSCTCVESLNKRDGALANPQEDFEVILSAPDLIDKYVKLHDLIGKEKKGTGFTRLLRCLTILQDTGVIGTQDDVVLGPFRIQSLEEISLLNEPKSSPSVEELFEDGIVLLGTFRISKNYRKLKAGDIYTYDAINPERVNGRTCSHAVAIIGYGVRAGIWYYVFQNSHGEEWGENGIGRVNMNSITQLVHVKI